ncbi:hypothetical protein PIROE2DRAFT_19437 [Piromyces sp. E2]|nr:hypothetical protein PIROE2DRAFT_19437 [Piromyces sp. E2]|eukprot:OUM56109.1 hypothetical protein PIROE2DRAFT_19437 [Piromyces sp. E2]
MPNTVPDEVKTKKLENEKKKINEWESNLFFLLAMIGSTLGLGNIWRFSYVLYNNVGATSGIMIYYATVIGWIAIYVVLRFYNKEYGGSLWFLPAYSSHSQNNDCLMALYLVHFSQKFRRGSRQCLHWLKEIIQTHEAIKSLLKDSWV